MIDYNDLIDSASRRYGVPREWITAMMGVESAGDPMATSHAGARGLMQVMPGTYAELRQRYPEIGEDPYGPANSINAGAAYISEMSNMFGGDPERILIAYNAGPGRAQDYTGDRSVLPQETQDYLTDLLPQIEGIPMPGYAPLPSVTNIGLPPGGILPQPAQPALGVPPDPYAALPAEQGGVAEFLSANPMALLGLGVGMLGAAGPSPTPQSAFGAGMQGFMAGSRMDQQIADRRRQQEQQAALQQAIGGAGLDPTTAALAQAFPDVYAEQVLGGIAGAAPNIQTIQQGDEIVTVTMGPGGEMTEIARGPRWNPNPPPAAEVNINEASRDAAREASIGIDAGILEGFLDSANRMRSMLPDLDRLEVAINTYQDTGAFGETRLLINQAAQALGLNVEGLPEGEVISAIVSRLAPQLRVQGSGHQSDRDVALLVNSLPNLLRTPEGNRRVLEFTRRLIERRQEEANLAYEAFQDGRLGPEFFNELDALPSLFTDDERSYLSGQSDRLIDRISQMGLTELSTLDVGELDDAELEALRSRLLELNP